MKKQRSVPFDPESVLRTALTTPLPANLKDKAQRKQKQKTASKKPAEK